MGDSPRYHTCDPILYRQLQQFATEKRKNQTEAEMILWKALSGNKLGLHFRRQHIISRYIADFICLRANLIIEVDGGYHAQAQQIINDYLRTEELEDMGYRVIRFTNYEILNDLSHILDYIYETLIYQISNGK